MRDQTPITVPLIVKKSSVQNDSLESKSNNVTATEAATDEAPVSEHVPTVVPAVYVGNLSLCTEESGLAAFFGSIGNVLNSKIIKSHRSKQRSAGYGFITFATMEEVFKATKELDKKLLNDREIRVQVARSNPRVASKSQVVEEVSTSSVIAQPTPISLSNTDHSIFENMNEKDEHAAQVDTVNVNNKAQSENASLDSEVPIVKPKRGYRKRRRPRPKKSVIEPSLSTIFVSNLNYSSTDDTLKEIFKEYEVKSVCVVKTATGRSTGYGFVDMASPQERTKLLASMKYTELDGRKISLKVARSQGPRSQTSNNYDGGSNGNEQKLGVDAISKGDQEHPASQENPVPTND